MMGKAKKDEKQKGKKGKPSKTPTVEKEPPKGGYGQKLAGLKKRKSKEGGHKR